MTATTPSDTRDKKKYSSFAQNVIAFLVEDNRLRGFENRVLGIIFGAKRRWQEGREN
jgi:hypothetical protein